MDEDCSTNIANSHQAVANVGIENYKYALNQAHEQKLEWINFANDDSKANQDGCSDHPTLHDINEGKLDNKLFVKPCEAKHNDCKLCDNNGHNHGEPESRHSVAFQESHQEAKASEEHHVDVHAKRICSEVVSETRERD